MSSIEIDGTRLEIEGEQITGSLLASASPNDPFHYEEVVPYYRRRQRDGLVKVFLKSPRALFEIVVSAEYAALLKPNQATTFDFSP